MGHSIYNNKKWTQNSRNDSFWTSVSVSIASSSPSTSPLSAPRFCSSKARQMRAYVCDNGSAERRQLSLSLLFKYSSVHSTATALYGIYLHLCACDLVAFLPISLCLWLYLLSDCVYSCILSYVRHPTNHLSLPEKLCHNFVAFTVGNVSRSLSSNIAQLVRQEYVLGLSALQMRIFFRIFLHDYGYDTDVHDHAHGYAIYFSKLRAVI